MMTEFSGFSRGVLVLAGLVIIVGAMKLAADLVTPFLLAVFIGALLSPLAIYLVERGIPEPLTLCLMVLMVFAVVGGLGLIITSSVKDFIEVLPTYEERFALLFQEGVTWLRGFGLEIPEKSLGELINPGALFSFAGGTLQRVAGLLSNGFLIFLILLFLVAEATSLPAKFQLAFGSQGKQVEFWRAFSNTLKHYLFLKTLISLVTGLTVYVLLLAMGINFPELWAFLAFFLNFIPAVGSLLAAIPAIALALIDQGLTSVIVIGAGYLVINLVFGSLIEPRVMGGQLGMSTLVVFVSLIFWGWVLGPVGMLLSVPLTMTLKIAMHANPDTRWLAILLGNYREAQQASVALEGQSPEDRSAQDLDAEGRERL